MPITKLIAIYARVSTARQEEEQTIQTQLSVLKEFAEKNGYSIVECYLDEGWSGDTLVRPSLDKLRQDVKKKLWDAVLIYDPDRLARRYSYQELIMDEIKEAGIEIIFITVASPKNSEDKILHGVRGLFAEYERVKISERFRLGKLRKIKEGHIMTGTPLYGYKYILKQETRPGYYEINEPEAKIVRMIFKWIDEEQLTLRGIVHRLKEYAIPPRKSKTGAWRTSTLSKMLKNRAYIGEAHWGSTYAVIPLNPTSKEIYRKVKKSSRKAKPLEEWLSVAVPQIIENDVFDRVRHQIEENFKLCQRNTKNEYLLAGRIWCKCGSRRAGEGPQNGKYLYYRCNDRVKTFPGPSNCKLKGVNARIADSLIWNHIKNLMCSPELITKQVERWVEESEKPSIVKGNDIENLHKQIQILKNQEDRYNRAYGAELISINQLKDYLKPVKEQIVMLQAQIIENKQKIQNNDIIIPDQNSVESFAKMAIQHLNNLTFDVKQTIIRLVVDKIIATQESLHIFGHLPVTEYNHVALFTSSRVRWDTKGYFIDKESKVPFLFSLPLPKMYKRIPKDYNKIYEEFYKRVA